MGRCKSIGRNKSSAGIIVVVSLLSSLQTSLQVDSSSSWLWPQQQQQQQSSPSSAASSPPVSFVAGDDDDESEVVEARGYFTFLDVSTSPRPPPTVPSTVTPINNSCICVPYYLCDDGQYVDTSVIDLRQPGWCHSALDVCCRTPRPTSPPTPTLPPTVTATPGFVPQCGTLNPNGVNARILGFKDSETQFGEYPWMGAVLESRYLGGKWVLQFVCGASLITPRVVVTAAHCVKGKKPGVLTVRLGEWDTQSTSEFYPYQDVKVGEVVSHPGFYGGGLYNDVALLFLRTSVVLAPHVDTVCLPSGEYDNTSCWATGWGKSAFGPSGSYQAILREVNLAVSPALPCQSALRKTNLGANFVLHDSFLCAGGLKNLDTCVGDGGGPLVCPSTVDPWRYVLVGIVSWGVNCGTYGVPGVYVNGPKFRGWIDGEIKRRYPGWSASRWTIEGSATTTKPGGQGG